MKIPFVASLLIFAIAAVCGWQLDQRLASARTLAGKLTADAARLGIAIDPANPLRITKRPRATGEDPVQLAADYIEVATALEAVRASGVPSDGTLSKRSTELWKRMRLLDFSQTKILIAELHASGYSGKEYGIYSLLNDLVIDQPQTVLTLLTESADLVQPESRDRLMLTALAGWARENPLAAFDWIQKNGGLFPAETTPKLKVQVVYGAAFTDPKLAFELLGKSGLEDKGGYAGGILKCAETAETRTAALAAYREYFANLKDEKARKVAGANAVSGLTENLAKDGFAAAAEWLAGANLTPDELKRFANHLPSSAKTAERGQWIDWIGKTLPPDKAADGIWQNVTEWTKTDYQAAGKWLAATPDGPAKITAIRAYADLVAGIEPETATQWALTLPPGKDRDEILKRIHDKAVIK
ncbi:MAG: hypothetical protein V4819_15540 [Verrucomicrobiota bacterium]